MEQQRAWRRLAGLHEAAGAYDEALAALRRWTIAEPCGNGWSASVRRKTFWIYRLRLASGDLQTLPDLWTAFLAGDLRSAHDDGTVLAACIRRLYGNDREGLARDVQRIARRLQDEPPVDAEDDRSLDERPAAIAELRRRLALESELPDASPQRLIELIRERVPEEDSLGGETEMLLRPPGDRFHDPCDPLVLLVGELASRGAAAATAIEADLAKRRRHRREQGAFGAVDGENVWTEGDLHGPLLVALSRCGGPETLAGLRSRFQKEGQWNRGTLYRILLASGDADTVAWLRERSEDDDVARNVLDAQDQDPGYD